MLQIAKVPENDEHDDYGIIHPAPFVMQPAKKLLQSVLVVVVMGASEQNFTVQGVVDVAPAAV